MALAVHRQARACLSCSWSASSAAVTPMRARQPSSFFKSRASSRSCHKNASLSQYAADRRPAAISSAVSASARSRSARSHCAASDESNSSSARRTAAGSSRSSFSSRSLAACQALAARRRLSSSARPSVCDSHAAAKRATQGTPLRAGRAGAPRSSPRSVVIASSSMRALSTSQRAAGVSVCCSARARRKSSARVKRRRAPASGSSLARPVGRKSAETARK